MKNTTQRDYKQTRNDETFQEDSNIDKWARNLSSENEEQIRKRAYQLAEKRGFQPGHELDDWIQAKKLLSQDSSY
ncbi:MAG: DUF2934 domain-containing protein [Candidatus Omnitrophica bacterium]|nr:DUF2934 domain-containing protein [Candidatus Omnitrophota bacterium]